MLFELLATLIAGVAGAGLMMMLNRGLGGQLPRWLVPVAAGAAMLAATISSEYSWYPRTRDALPEGIVVAQAVDKRPGFRIWARVWPYVDHFAAIDTHSIRTNEALPDQRIADLYFYGRWQQVRRMPVAADCKALSRAQLTESTGFADDGSITGADWISVSADDPLLASICGN